MLFYLCRLLSINHRVLELTHQTRQCLVMVALFICIFEVLGLLVLVIFFLSVLDRFPYSFLLSLATTIGIGFFQYVSYRQLICDILFSQNYLRIILLTLLTSFINLVVWLPSSLSFGFHVELEHLSTFEWLSLNKYSLFLIGIEGLTIFAFSIIPMWALYNSARLHRVISIASISN